MSATTAREAAASIARAAIEAIDVRAILFEALPRLPPPRARVTAIAIGKGAPSMMRAAFDRWGDRIERAIVVTTDETSVAALATSRVEVLRASHPLPDDRGVAATARILDVLRDRGSGDVTLCMISGGASSLVCAPVDGVTLAEKREVVAAMLASGAPIADVNVVRRHLSRIKGGGVARASLPGRTLTMIASDVLIANGTGTTEGEAWDVGSGPGSLDPTSVDEARAAISRWAPQLAAVADRMRTTFAANDEEARRVRSKIVVSPRDLERAAVLAAQRAGFAVTTRLPSIASVDAIAHEAVADARAIREGEAIVRVCEASVTLPNARGRGGRAGRTVLSALLAGLPPDVGIACVASDGVDGSSGNAGGAVDGTMEREGAQEALSRFDDGAWLAERSCAVTMGATGKNLLDVLVVARARR